MKTLIVGIGSPILGDDGVGIHVARALQDRPLPDATDVIELGTAGLSLLDRVAGYRQLIFIDAIVSGAEPGTVHRLTGEDVARTTHLGPGHEADLPTLLSLGRKMLGDGMPTAITVIAIEAAQLTRFSESLTPAVEAAIPDAVAEVERLLGA